MTTTIVSNADKESERAADSDEILINDPDDIMGMGIRNVLLYRMDDSDFRKLVLNWDKIVFIEIKHLYGVKVRFFGNTIEIGPISSDGANNYDIKLILDSLQTMVDMAKGDLNPIIGVLKGRIKVKKIWNVGVILKFLRIFMPNLRIAGERAKRYDFE